jgi:FMN reductase
LLNLLPTLFVERQHRNSTITAPLTNRRIRRSLRPSRTQVLSQDILDEVGSRLNIAGRVIELANLARDVGGALNRKELPAEIEAQLQAIESADLAPARSPVRRGGR